MADAALDASFAGTYGDGVIEQLRAELADRPTTNAIAVGSGAINDIVKMATAKLSTSAWPRPRPRAALAALLIRCRSYKGPRSSDNVQSVNLHNAQVQGGTDDGDLELREGFSNGTLTSS